MNSKRTLRRNPAASGATATDEIRGAPGVSAARTRTVPPDGEIPESEESIRLAAYFIAERRGFEPGHELDDWLAAEALIGATAERSVRSPGSQTGRSSRDEGDAMAHAHVGHPNMDHI